MEAELDGVQHRVTRHMTEWNKRPRSPRQRKALRQQTAIQKVLDQLVEDFLYQAAVPLQRHRSLLEVEALLIQLEEELQTREGILPVITAFALLYRSGHKAKRSHMLRQRRSIWLEAVDLDKECHHPTILLLTETRLIIAKITGIRWMSDGQKSRLQTRLGRSM